MNSPPGWAATTCCGAKVRNGYGMSHCNDCGVRVRSCGPGIYAPTTEAEAMTLDQAEEDKRRALRQPKREARQ